MLAFAILGAVSCVGCGGGTLDAEALSKQAEALQSVAAEGALLGQAAASGETTQTFAREHSAALSELAAKTQESLRGATTQPSLQPSLRRLTTLAADTTAALEQLRDATQVEQRELAAMLRAAADQAERIAGS